MENTVCTYKRPDKPGCYMFTEKFIKAIGGIIEKAMNGYHRTFFNFSSPVYICTFNFTISLCITPYEETIY